MNDEKLAAALAMRALAGMTQTLPIPLRHGHLDLCASGLGAGLTPPQPDPEDPLQLEGAWLVPGPEGLVVTVFDRDESGIPMLLVQFDRAGRIVEVLVDAEVHSLVRST